MAHYSSLLQKHTLSQRSSSQGGAGVVAISCRFVCLAATLLLTLGILPLRAAAQANAPSGSAGSSVQLVHLPSVGQPGQPVSITFKEALERAQKSDPTFFFAGRDAKSAHEDSVQAKAALLPNFQYSNQYLNTQGDGSTTIGRYVTNDGVHVYRSWLMMHQDLSPGTFMATGYHRATAAEALANAKAEIARRGLVVAVTKMYYTLVVAQRKYATAEQALDEAQQFYKIRTTQFKEPAGEESHSDAGKEGAESAKDAAESAKDAADSAKEAAETAKEASESATKAASGSRKATNPAEKGTGPARETAEPVKEGEESAKEDAEPAQQSAEPAREEAEKGEEIDPRDALKAEIQLRQQEQAFEEAELAVEDARLDLSVVLFSTPNENFTVVDDLESVQELPPFPEVQAKAAMQDQDLRVALESVHEADLDVTTAKTAFLPTLTVDFIEGIEANQFALHGVNVEFPDKGILPNLGYFLTVNLTVPVWNWGALNSKLKQTVYKQEEARVALTQTQRQSLTELYEAYNEAVVARAALDKLKLTVDLAVESLRLVNLPTKGGEPVEVDQVVDAQAMLATTRGAYDDGQIRYRLALANLQTITGSF